MEESEISVLLRKIQLTGGSTYIVSLPKNWARRIGIKPGDHVQIIPQPDMSLLIIPKEEKRKEEPSEALIDASTVEKPEDVAREFIACYLVGFDIIRLRFGQKATEYRVYIKDIIRRKLIGVETIEESANYMATRCLLGHVEFPVKDALSRMHILSESMHKDAATALKNGDFSLANDVAQRDDEVDRLYFFVVRQLKMAVQNRFMMEEVGLSTMRDCIGYRLIAKSIERIADHATRIGRVIPTMKYPIVDKIIVPILRMSNTSTNVCQKAMKTVFQLNIRKANQTITKTDEVTQLEKEMIEQILRAKLSVRTIIGLRLILESIRRTAEYGADIAEIAINLAKKP